MRQIFSVIFLGVVKMAFSQSTEISMLTADRAPSCWNTTVDETSFWRYKEGHTEIESGWMISDFDASKWKKGRASIGYGDSDDLTIIQQTPSVYMRTDFELSGSDIKDLRSLLLEADYDDGFIAWINGVEVVRVNLGAAGTFVPHLQQVTHHREAKMYEGGRPEYFLLNKAEFRNIVHQGSNTLAIQLQNDGAESSDLTGKFWLSCGFDRRDSSSTWSGFAAPVYPTRSNLPWVMINTDGQPILDEPKVMAGMTIIKGSSSLNKPAKSDIDFEGTIGIEIRGSSSQTRFPKKSYGFETRKKNGSNLNTSLLGMPEENDWILYGPYSDKSLLRTGMTYQLYQKTGHYAPRWRWCELIINEKYEGVYLLMEKIKPDANRINIKKLTNSDSTEMSITGGYIIKIDKTTGGDGAGWHSVQKSRMDNQFVFYQYSYPKSKEITIQQQEWIKNYLHKVEAELADNNFSRINIASFVDFFLINELSYNVDGYRLSTFLYKDRDDLDSTLHIGPPWDFNLSFGNGYDCQSQNDTGWVFRWHASCPDHKFQIPEWWENIFNNPAASLAMKVQWENLRNSSWHNDSILHLIDLNTNLLTDAAHRNFRRWPILETKVWPNSYHADSYEGEVAILKSWLLRRLRWMDKQLEFGN